MTHHCEQDLEQDLEWERDNIIIHAEGVRWQVCLEAATLSSHAEGVERQEWSLWRQQLGGGLEALE